MNKRLILGGFLLTLMIIVAGCQAPLNPPKSNSSAKNGLMEDVSWRCSRAVCEEFIDGREWAKQNCDIKPVGVNGTNALVCPVVINNQQYEIPIENLNLSAIQQCVKYRCVEETPYRAVNYTLNATQ